MTGQENMASPSFNQPSVTEVVEHVASRMPEGNAEEEHISNFNQLCPGDLIGIQHGPKWSEDNYYVVHHVNNISEDGQMATLIFSDGNSANSGQKTEQFRLQRLFVFLKKVRYNERKFSPADTVERANQLEKMFNTEDTVNDDVNTNAHNANGNDNDDNVKSEGSGADDNGRKKIAVIKKIKYDLFRQNCEHFASACVNGPDVLKKDSIKESLSVQARDCVWIIISLVFWVFQAIFYGFNFWLYAVFVRKDCDFEFLTDNLDALNWCCNYCYKGYDNCAEFIPIYTAKNCSKFISQSPEGTHYDTICDWILIGIFVGFSLILSIIIALIYRKDKLMCKRCFDSLCINLFFSRNVSIILIEAINILSEDLLYSAVIRWKLDRGSTVVMLIIVSAFGALCIYSLASVLTKIVVLVCSTDRLGFWRCLGCWKCSSNCCKSSCCETYSGRSSPCSRCCMAWRGYAKYVPFRGIIRCCLRNAHSKYLQPRIDEEDARQDACMVCRIEIPIFNFNQIEPGDHISMPGAAQFANFLYKHQAIVTKIENVSKDGTEANLEVTDVPRTGKGWCSSEQIPVQRHSLFDAARHRLTSSRWVHGYSDGVRIIKQKQVDRRSRPTGGGQREASRSLESSSEETQAKGQSGVSVESVDLQDLSQSQTAPE